MKFAMLAWAFPLLLYGQWFGKVSGSLLDAKGYNRPLATIASYHVTQRDFSDYDAEGVKKYHKHRVYGMTFSPVRGFISPSPSWMWKLGYKTKDWSVYASGWKFDSGYALSLFRVGSTDTSVVLVRMWDQNIWPLLDYRNTKERSNIDFWAQKDVLAKMYGVSFVGRHSIGLKFFYLGMHGIHDYGQYQHVYIDEPYIIHVTNEVTLKEQSEMAFNGMGAGIVFDEEVRMFSIDAMVGFTAGNVKVQSLWIDLDSLEQSYPWAPNRGPLHVGYWGNFPYQDHWQQMFPVGELSMAVNWPVSVLGTIVTISTGFNVKMIYKGPDISTWSVPGSWSLSGSTGWKNRTDSLLLYGFSFGAQVAL